MPLITLAPYNAARASSLNLVLAMDFDNGAFTDIMNPSRAFTTTNANGSGGGVSVSTALKRNGTHSLLQTQVYANSSGLLQTTRTTDLTFDGDFWVEFWAYCLGQGNSVYTGADNWLFSYGTYAGTGLNGFYLDDLRLAFAVRNGAYPAQIAISTATTTNNAWHHYAFGRKDGVLYLFLDGAVVASANYAGTFGYDTMLAIGGCRDARINNATYSGVNGYMDRIRVYNGRCLTTTNFTPEFGSF